LEKKRTSWGQIPKEEVPDFTGGLLLLIRAKSTPQFPLR
jgi:hypothetical protein